MEKKIAELDGKCTMRTGSGKDGPIISDNGNIIMDCDFGTIDNPAMLGDELSVFPAWWSMAYSQTPTWFTSDMRTMWRRRKPKKIGR